MIHSQKEAFFEKMDQEFIGLTYADVQVEPARGEFDAREVDLTSRFSRNIELKSPIVSAAMDKVTTSDMAIAMAKLGGIGVIHASLSAEDQRNEVRRVKKHLNGLISDPVCVHQDDSIEQVLNMRDDRGYGFSSFPVIDNAGKLVGLIAQNDFDFVEDNSDSISTAMKPAEEIVSAINVTSIQDAYAIMRKNKVQKLPIVNSDNEVIGFYVWKDVERIITQNSGLYNVDAYGSLLVAAAVRTDPSEAVERVDAMQKYVDVIVLDSARGDSKHIFKTLGAIKSSFPEIDVVVGNVSAADSAKDLAAAGADGIKVGQGPGSICSTRQETGIGIPQVTAVYRCARAVENHNIPVCADGGIVDKGDVTKAISAGAESVMMGSLLAGTKEAPGKIIEDGKGNRVKIYRGMGSLKAFQDNDASRERYGAVSDHMPLPEGVESVVPYKGSVLDVASMILKGLRKGMEYSGCVSIQELREKSTLIRNTPAGIIEAKPHDVRVITLSEQI
jgi:IMP dehydrogenase